MTVIAFPLRPFVAISSGNVSITTCISEAGRTTTTFDPPRTTFFVDFVDGDGVSCVVWDGESHADAVEIADGWSASGIPVRDLTDSAWRRN